MMKPLLYILLLTTAALAERTDKKITLSEVKKHLTCAAPMVSHWVQEQGFATQIEVNYGPYLITRTDVGVPDGKVRLAKSKSLLCDLEISVVPDLYLSSKDELFITNEQGVGGEIFRFYSIKQAKCEFLGYVASAHETKLVRQLLSENDGKLTCKRARL